MSLNATDAKKREQLVHKRGAIKSRLTRFKALLVELEANPDVHQLNAHMGRLEFAFAGLEAYTAELQELEPQVDHYAEQAMMEDDFTNLIARCSRLKEKIAEAKAAEAANSSFANHASPNPFSSQPTLTRLPEQALPRFNGKYEDWLSFQDDFQSMIGRRQGLSDTDKLKYLRSCLSGEPERLVKQFETTDEGYRSAWHLLKKMFEDKGRIRERHVTEIFNTPTIQRESSQDLSVLVNTLELHCSALKSLNEDTFSTMMLCITLSKIDKATRRQWRMSLKEDELPTYDQLISFLRRMIVTSDEPLILVKNDKSGGQSKGRNDSQNSNNGKGPRQTRSLVTTATNECSICKNNHQLFQCSEFKKLSAKERYQAAIGASLCINCLRSGHVTPRVAPEKSKITSLTGNIPSKDLLVTAKVHVSSLAGKLIPCRALLDTCSNTNFMTERLASRLNLPKTKLKIPVGAMNHTRTVTNNLVTTKIRSRLYNFERNLSFLTINDITGLVPDERISRNSISLPRNIKLADPEFDQPAEVDMLIGSGTTLSILCVGQINLSKHGGPDLYLQKTRLGWIIGGAIPTDGLLPYKQQCHVTTLDSIMKRFWEIEEIDTKRHSSPEEISCEDHFKRTVSRDNDGRYIVALPFNNKKDQLGESRSMATKRLLGLERKLQRDPELKGHYNAVLQEYLALGHMSKVHDNTATGGGFYLPHHAVIKDSSLTTKVRVVFDGSARSSTGLSLNDTLMVGPTIQDDIFSLLLRFRDHQYVITGDIEKMYRQFNVRKEDREYQRILWRDASGSIVTYELNTLTFGLSPAPFLATRCLHQLADDEMTNYPRAAQIIKRDLYVDDLLTGAATFRDALDLRNEINQLLQRGGLNLRQWASNEPQLLQGLPSGSMNLKLQSRQDQTIKTLGVYWNSEQDAIVYTVSPISRNERVTKRTILSHIARIFDPLGLLGPVVTHAKIIMQRLWRERLEWDESIPAEIYTEWNNYASQLSLLNDLRFNRKFAPPQSQEIQLHGYCDASEKAYGACIYIRATDTCGNVSTTLLCAKSRVAPLKNAQDTQNKNSELQNTPVKTEIIPPMTIPKLELCGAVLLAKLYSTVRQALNTEVHKTVLWCDNTAVLNWINTPPYQLLTFVANRVSIIQEKTHTSDWRHVRSLDNPADLISRGQLPSAYISDLKWKNGPTWLIKEESTWPQIGVPTMHQLPGLRKIKCLATPIHSDILTKYSSIVRLRRFVAYALRFKTQQKGQGHLTCEELEAANLTIIKLVQAATFPSELRDLQEEKIVDPKSKLISLAPFVDNVGIIRVGGRITNSKFSFAEKHPIILPRSHHVTSLIIQYEHISNYHSGILTTLYSLRRKYWIIDGRNQVRKVIRSCMVCAKANPPSANYIMGNLPGVRITEARPFLNVGVDYCGPFFIKEKKHRNRGSIKVYVAVFICLVVKAVHLELVSDMTTEAFLAALKRFIARRGRCENIYSDNGTNFVGANNELKAVMEHLRSEDHNEKTLRFCTDHGIKWHFIPPQAPNFGGIWEAAVKSFKHHLRRVVGEQLLTFEQFYTFLTEVEAILNSRPLTPISSDPNDPPVLSPGHYLIGNTLTSIPEVNLINTPSNRLSLWQHIQKMKQDFWARWHKEYLNELNIRHKWSRGSHSIREGTLVLLKEDNLPPLRWLMGRVIETRPGADGIVRVVRVKTSRGILDRNVRKLAPLPLPIEINSDSDKTN